MKATVTFVGSGDAFGSGGRFQTCILVDIPGLRFVIDFGASSLIALNKFVTAIPAAAVAIMLTYYLAQWLILYSVLQTAARKSAGVTA